MTEDADGLRLVKEVLFQRYVESLLHLMPSLPKKCRPSNMRKLGQLVTKDIYNGSAIYCLDQDSFDSGKHTLHLVKKENTFTNNMKSVAVTSQMSCDGVSAIEVKTVTEIDIPGNVVNKLKNLLQGIEQKTKEKEEKDNKDLRKLLLELKAEVDNSRKDLKDELENSRKEFREFVEKSEQFLHKCEVPRRQPINSSIKVQNLPI